MRPSASAPRRQGNWPFRMPLRRNGVFGIKEAYSILAKKLEYRYEPARWHWPNAMTLTTGTRRPRNVDAPRAAAILYGDWGTSKAYVIGLAFAVGGYSSFWLIAAMCLLTALVGVNYMAICKHYPDGGGVYASVRHRSEIISIVGAFLLIADYIVTAAISALSAFQYLQVSHPEIWAGLAILFIGGLNYFGPASTRGGLAFLVSVPTVAVRWRCWRSLPFPISRMRWASFAAVAGRVSEELGGVCGGGAGFVGRGGDCQFHRRDETQQRLQRRQSQRFQNLHARHSVGAVGSVHLHRLAQSGHERLAGADDLRLRRSRPDERCRMLRGIRGCAITC